MGYLIGVNDQILTKNYQESLDIAYAIFRHQCKPAVVSASLVNQLFDSIHCSPYFFLLPRNFWSEVSRHLFFIFINYKFFIIKYNKI